MKKYSIREVEKLTGIKAHTIRVWEKRYNLGCAERTETNIRYYSDEELKKFINIALLIDSGSKISKVVLLDTDQLCEEIKKLSGQDNAAPRVFVDRFVNAMIDMDEAKFHEILDECIRKFGFTRAMITVVYPFLEKTGILWQTNHISPIQEHFVSNLIRQKILAETDKLGYRIKQPETFLLFLPVDELHEIGLLFYNYYLRKQGYKVYYFGQSVPFNDLAVTLENLQADYLFTYFVAGKTGTEICNYLADLEKIFTGKSIFITGMLCEQVSLNGLKKCTRVQNMDEFCDCLSVNWKS